MVGVAVGWQVYAIHGNPLDLGLVGLAEFIPLLLVALPAGQLADRMSRRGSCSPPRSPRALFPKARARLRKRVSLISGASPRTNDLSLTQSPRSPRCKFVSLPDPDRYIANRVARSAFRACRNGCRRPCVNSHTFVSAGNANETFLRISSVGNALRLTGRASDWVARAPTVREARPAVRPVRRVCGVPRGAGGSPRGGSPRVPSGHPPRRR